VRRCRAARHAAGGESLASLDISRGLVDHFGLEFAEALWSAVRSTKTNARTSSQRPEYRKTIMVSIPKSDVRRLFTANFRMLLSAAKWTQVEAAEQLGISQGSVSDFTSGNRMPSTKGIESIAYRLGIPAEAFTSKPITLDQMRRLLSGSRTLKISEPRAAYRGGKPYDPWLRSLKQRWKRNPESRDEIRIAIRVLFGNETRAVINWLDAR
jgi:transcriptional regulator with XRE-family HTH domain